MFQKTEQYNFTGKNNFSKIKFTDNRSDKNKESLVKASVNFDLAVFFISHSKTLSSLQHNQSGYKFIFCHKQMQI